MGMEVLFRTVITGVSEDDESGTDWHGRDKSVQLFSWPRLVGVVFLW